MKRVIRATNSLGEDERYQQIFADVVEEVEYRLTQHYPISAEKMSRVVKGYKPEWASTEYAHNAHSREIQRTLQKLSQLIAEDYFTNYNKEA